MLSVCTERSALTNIILLQTPKFFSSGRRSSEVKYFAFDFEEALIYASKAYNRDVVAIFQVRIKRADLQKVGDFTDVDPNIFKKGTVVIQPDKLSQFNSYIIDISLKL